MNVNDCGKVCVATIITSCGAPNQKAVQDCVAQCMQYSHFPNLNPIDVGRDLANALKNRYGCGRYTEEISPSKIKKFSRDISWEPVVIIGVVVLLGLMAPEIPAAAAALRFAF